MMTIHKIDSCQDGYTHIDETFNERDKSKIEKLMVEGLAPVRKNVSCRLADTLVESFIYLYENRNNETREIRLITESFVLTYNQTLDIFQQHGMEQVLRELLPIFKGQKLSHLIRDLGMEQGIFARAGLDHHTFKAYGEFLDSNLSEAVEAAQSGKLSMNMLRIPDNCGYLGSHNGNSWDGFVGFLSGAILVANAVCTIPTAGIAAASVVVGVAGGGYAIAH
jgi:hypothetical protein